MLTYSVTVNVDKAILQDWLTWMRTVHVPEVLATGHFTECRIHLLGHPEPEDAATATYNFQYRSENQEQLNAYLANDAARLRQEHHAKFGSGAVAFRTILVEVETQTARSN